MGKTATNSTIVLGIITIVFAGYYLYAQRDATTLGYNSSANERLMQDMLNNTRVYKTYRQTLDQVQLDIAFFDDPRFLSLQRYTTPIQEQSIGRPNPFSETTAGATAVPSGS